MYPPYVTPSSLHAFIQAALVEDINEEDISSRGAIDASIIAKAKLLVKDEGIIAGVDLAEKIFQQYDPKLSVEFFKRDGDAIVKGDVALIVEGPARSILSTERVVLNCMQRMSGIATYTRRLSKIVEGTKARIMDTRKTTPNFRLAEKWAVAIGGGVNHRFNLFGMVMLKDNHNDLAGGIRASVESTQKYLKDSGQITKIEVETRNLKEVEEVLAIGGVDVIMLDNMSINEMALAVKRINGACLTEASGGITEATLRDVANCGVDYISVGALTHSVRSLDLSLKVVGQ